MIAGLGFVSSEVVRRAASMVLGGAVCAALVCFGTGCKPKLPESVAPAEQGQPAEEPAQESMPPAEEEASASAVEETAAPPSANALLRVDFESVDAESLRNLRLTQEQAHSPSSCAVMEATAAAERVLTDIGGPIDLSGVQGFTLSLWTQVNSLANGVFAVRIVYFGADDAVIEEDRVGVVDAIESEFTQHVFASRIPIPENAAYGKVQLGLRTAGTDGLVEGRVFIDDIELLAN